MKKILVTGGAGFIGSHLCKKLLDNNNDVLCIDNYFTGTKENISELEKEIQFALLPKDKDDKRNVILESCFCHICRYQLHWPNSLIWNLSGGIFLI